MLRIAAVLAAGLLLTACASPLSGEYAGSNGKTLLVTQKVWGWYKEYLTKISGVNRGLFVVAVYNGVASSAYYYYCPGTSCLSANYSKKAMDGCRSYGAEYECILFANSGSVVVNYKVMGE
ncbi:hypothetical protein [Dongia sp. agr-C8]